MQSTTSSSFSSSLNIDTVRAIFRYLDIRDALRCRRVSKVWKYALNDQRFLQALAAKILKVIDSKIILPESPDFQKISEKLVSSGTKFIGEPEDLLLHVLHGGKIAAEHQSILLHFYC